MEKKPWWVSQAEGIAKQKKEEREALFDEGPVSEHVPWPYSDEGVKPKRVRVKQKQAAGGKTEKPKKFQIVLAWVSPDFEVVRPGRTDLGEQPVLKQVLVPRAAMWLRRGTDEDLEKAKAYAKAQKGEYVFVFTYIAAEKDPIGRAKKEAKEILAKYGWMGG